jgi:hypothetical protein
VGFEPTTSGVILLSYDHDLRITVIPFIVESVLSKSHLLHH